MGLPSNLEDTKNILSRAKSVALLLPQKASLDDYFSASALGLWLKERGANIRLISDNPTPPEVLELGGFKAETGFSKNNDLVLTISNQNAEPGQLRYEKTEQGLKIFITPKQGQFKNSDITFQAQVDFNLIVCFSEIDWHNFGQVYTDNVPTLEKAPSLALSTKPNHKYFTSHNLIAPEFCSVSEVVAKLLENEKFLSPNFYTLLLAGLYSQTNALRNSQIKASSFLLSAELLEKGAKHQEVSRVLYGTKPFSSLKLLGVLLENLQNTKSGDFYTLVTDQALLDLNQSLDNLETAGWELANFLDYTKNLFIFSNDSSNTVLYVWTPAHSNIQITLETLGFKFISAKNKNRFQVLSFSAPGLPSQQLKKILSLNSENT